MRTWIFQANPAVFDIDGYLAASTGIILWTVKQHVDEIEPGDTVYLWRSAGADKDLSGICAEARVLDSPALRADDEGSKAFWLKPQDNERPAMRAVLRLLRVASKKEALKRDWLKEDSVASGLSILKQPAGTNFPVTTAQAKRLRQLWSRTGTGWTRDEVVAALHLYDQFGDSPISLKPGSPVEQTAQLIGRASTAVYNKLMNLRALDPRATQKGLAAGSKIDAQVWEEFFDSTTRAMWRNELNAEFKRLWSSVTPTAIQSKSAEEAEASRLSKRPLDVLLDQYRKNARNERPARVSVETFAYVRDPLVVSIARLRASNHCEVDHCTSPVFVGSDGQPFVEVHHLTSLADGGTDSIDNAVCLCPTHHRMMHHAKDASSICEQLRLLRAADSKR